MRGLIIKRITLKDQTVWSTPNIKADDSFSWKLRCANHSLSNLDYLNLAAIVESYEDLLYDSTTKRSISVLKELRKKVKEQ